MKNQGSKPTVNLDELSVDFWRKRFQEAFERFDGLTQVAHELGQKSNDFEGLSGFRRLENIKRGKGGLAITARAVELMEQLRPIPTTPASRLSRQKLSKF